MSKMILPVSSRFYDVVSVKTTKHQKETSQRFDGEQHRLFRRRSRSLTFYWRI